MEKPIYLDYNATTPIDAEVAAYMKQFIDAHYGNPSSGYAAGKFARDAVQKAREQVATLIGARPDEVVFTSCATESNNLAILGVLKGKQGRHIITSAVEHPAVMEVCKYLATQGYSITYIPVDKNGRIQPQDVEKAIQPDTALISIMHANNETGTIQPISEVAGIAHRHGIVFHTDAAQSVGKIPADVNASGVDLMSIAGHKMYAPKGVGALYVKKGTAIQNIMFGAGQESGIRPGTENVVHIAALGKACEIALRDGEKNRLAMQTARDHLLNGLRAHLGDGFVLNNVFGQSLPNTLSIAFPGVHAHKLAAQIGNEVSISTGSACHADSIEISPVLKAMQLDASIATATLRISTGKYTTPQEAEKAADIVAGAVLWLRKTE